MASLIPIEIERITQTIAEQPENEDLYFRRAIEWYKNEYYKETIGDCTYLLRLNVKRADAYLLRARCLAYFEDYTGAIADCTHTLELMPDDWEAYAIRGECYYHSKEYEKAIFDCTQAINRNTDDWKTYWFRGCSYFKQSDYEKAIADYNRVILSAPQKAEAYSYRERCYFETNQYVEAVQDWFNTLRYGKDEQYTAQLSKEFLERGDWYRDAGKLDQAIEIYTGLIEYGLADETIYHKRGACYYEKGRYRKAANDYEDFFDETQHVELEDHKIIKDCYENILKEQDRDIFQAISHTMNNLLFAESQIIKGFERNFRQKDLTRLKLYHRMIATTMNAIQVTFSESDNAHANFDISEQDDTTKTSLYAILYLCLNINLNHLLDGFGRWEGNKNIFFTITETNRAEIETTIKQIRASDVFFLHNFDEVTITRFVEYFKSPQLERIHRSFDLRLEPLRHLFVTQDEYAFAVLFVIFLELTKNMLRYGAIRNQTLLNMSIHCQPDEQGWQIRFSNTARQRVKPSGSTFQGLKMVEAFARNLLGGFETLSEPIEQTHYDRFTATIFLKRKG